MDEYMNEELHLRLHKICILRCEYFKCLRHQAHHTHTPCPHSPPSSCFLHPLLLVLTLLPPPASSIPSSSSSLSSLLLLPPSSLPSPHPPPSSSYFLHPLFLVFILFPPHDSSVLENQQQQHTKT